MKISRSLLLSGLLAMMLHPAVGIAGDKPNFSGFLEDYSDFEESPKISGSWRFIKPGAKISDLKKYNKIMLDPIEVWIHPKAKYQGVDPNQLKGMTDYFRNAIVKAMAPDYPVVGNPGDDVLRVSIAITGVVPQKPKRSALGYIPIAFVLSSAKSAVDSAEGQEAIQLEASVEAAFVDTATNERMFAVVDSHRGDKMMARKGQADLGWESTKSALDFWASELRKRFDETHGKVAEDSPFGDFDAG